MSSVIAPRTLAQLIESEDSPQLLDVRTPAEFEAAHISGSKLAPLDAFNPSQIAEVFNLEKPIYVICRSGNRASQAIEKLKAHACNAGVLLEGGVIEWEKESLPLNRGNAIMGLERQVRIAAGLMIVAGALLGFFVNPLWHLLSAFVGAGLTFAGLTDSCAMGMLIAKMPWNQKGSAAEQCAICNTSNLPA